MVVVRAGGAAVLLRQLHNLEVYGLQCLRGVQTGDWRGGGGKGGGACKTLNPKPSTVCRGVVEAQIQKAPRFGSGQR